MSKDSFLDAQDAQRDAQDMERFLVTKEATDGMNPVMSKEEEHEYLCRILCKLVDSDLTVDELKDLASALGIALEEFYGTPEQIECVEIIEWTEEA